MSQDSQFKAMDSYFHSLLNESVVAEPAPVVQPAPEPAVVTFAEPQGFAEQEKLQALLADVERVSKTEIKTPQKVSPSTLSTPVKVAPPAPPIWKNIETGREFQEGWRFSKQRPDVGKTRPLPPELLRLRVQPENCGYQLVKHERGY